MHSMGFRGWRSSIELISIDDRKGEPFLMLITCDIQLPFGRHHIHCYLFAPRGHERDGYWHEVCLHSLIF